MSSVIPASRTTWGPPRSRTCRTEATSQPARATRNRPGSIESRPGRRSLGIASSRAGSSRANRLGPGAGSPEAKTGNPPPTSSVSNVSIDPRHSAVIASARRTASRQASTAPSCEPTWRWMPRGLSGPFARRRPRWPRPARSRSSRTWSRRHRQPVRATSRAPRPGSADRARRARPTGHAAEDGGKRRGLVGRFDRDPAQGSAVARAAVAAARRSAAVLPIPSSVISRLATPARTAAAHSPRETTFAPKPCAATAAMIGGHVVGLDRIVAQPRVREGLANLGGGRGQRRQVGDVERGPEAPGGPPQRVRISRGRQAARRCRPGSARPTR